MANLQDLVNSSTATKSLIVHEYSESSPYHTSIDIKTTGVYNLFEGVVAEVGNEPGNLYYVCVKSSDNCIMRYGHLETCYGGAYDRIRPGELVGVAKKFATVQYVTLNTSKFPIYINKNKYYINDPTDIVVNDVSPSIKPGESTYKQTSDVPVALMGGVEPSDESGLESDDTFY